MRRQEIAAGLDIHARIERSLALLPARRGSGGYDIVKTEKYLIDMGIGCSK